MTRRGATDNSHHNSQQLAVEHAQLANELAHARYEAENAIAQAHALKKDLAHWTFQAESLSRDLAAVTNAESSAQMAHLQKENQKLRTDFQNAKEELVALQQKSQSQYQSDAEEIAALKAAHKKEASLLEAKIASLERDIHTQQGVNPSADPTNDFWIEAGADQNVLEQSFTSPRLPITALSRIAVLVDLSINSASSRLTPVQHKHLKRRERSQRRLANAFGRYGVRVYNIAASGIERCFEELSKIENVRVVVVGDDHVMQQVITAMSSQHVMAHYAYTSLPPIVPVGIPDSFATHDLSNALGWQGPWPNIRMHVTQDLTEFLECVQRAGSVKCDRWRVSFSDSESDKTSSRELAGTFAMGKEACGTLTVRRHDDTTHQVITANLKNFPGLFSRFEITVDGNILKVPNDAVSIVVMNAGSFRSYSGRVFRLSPSRHARAMACGDGFLDVVAVTTKGHYFAFARGQSISIVPRPVPAHSPEYFSRQYYLVDGDAWSCPAVTVTFTALTPSVAHVLHTQEYHPHIATTFTRAVTRKVANFKEMVAKKLPDDSSSVAQSQPSPSSSVSKNSNAVAVAVAQPKVSNVLIPPPSQPKVPNPPPAQQPKVPSVPPPPSASISQPKVPNAPPPPPPPQQKILASNLN
eukprot:c4017_g1_i1.p1 GENE.c4017_g1_i1~~c4017_g1_i1.p1  ORF type:complete len:640 (-),score=165.42 c4017_g1_i1:155-2074(-)